jgi:dihydrodipicolinate synthase/N-acetylneuraminate lyase
MQTTPITYDDLRSSVISVPPLARKADLSLNDAENTKLIKHLEAGGVRTFLYGGNANLYNIAVSEYAKLLEYLASAVAPTSIVVPSVGPFYGNIVDQADILKSFKFPTAMILPTLFPAKPAGIQVAVRHFVERSGIPAVLYIKDENYMPPEAAAQLVNEGLISWIKYAVVRENPAVDPYLTKLIDLVDRKLIVSGIGEQPAIIHLRDFGITGFTSGCVCVAPALSMKCMAAIHREDYAEAEAIRAQFEPLEDQRNSHGPIPVLHQAVQLAGVADTGPFLPLLAPLADERLPAIKQAALELLAKN